jgi:hypothetical protein
MLFMYLIIIVIIYLYRLNRLSDKVNNSHIMIKNNSHDVPYYYPIDIDIDIAQRIHEEINMFYINRLPIFE